MHSAKMEVYTRMCDIRDWCLNKHLIIDEMLKKIKQSYKTQQKHKATCPKQSFFKEKLAASGGIRTHDHMLSRQPFNRLTAGWVRITYTKQPTHLNQSNTQPNKQVNSYLA